MPVYCPEIIVECDFCMREESIEATEYMTGHMFTAGIEQSDLPDGWRYFCGGEIACNECEAED